MIARKAEKYIKRWIRESNKAFLVSGARQVGKTFTVRRCLVDEKANYMCAFVSDEIELPVLKSVTLT